MEMAVLSSCDLRMGFNQCVDRGRGRASLLKDGLWRHELFINILLDC